MMSGRPSLKISLSDGSRRVPRLSSYASSIRPSSSDDASSRPRRKEFKEMVKRATPADMKQLKTFRDANSGKGRSFTMARPCHNMKFSEGSRAMMAACIPPALSSSSKFPGAIRSNSFGRAEQFLRMGQADEDTATSNPSLRYLITRARRGSRRPSYSANASPNTATSGDANKGRPLVKLNGSARDKLSDAVAELTRSAQRHKEAAIFRNTKSQDTVQDTCVSSDSSRTPRLKRNSSSSEASTTSQSSCAGLARPKRAQKKNKSRRLLSGAGDCGRTPFSSPYGPTENRPILQLPDPSTISDPKALFAMARKMMSNRSSVQSPGSDDSVSAGICLELPSRQGSFLSSSSKDTSPIALLQHRLEVTSEVLRETESVTQEDGEKTLLQKMTESVTSIMEDDDELSFCSTTSLHSLPSVQQEAANGNDDDSIAFSIDSVRLHKQQIDTTTGSKGNSNQKVGEAAVGSLGATSHHHRLLRQTVVVEFDLDDDIHFQRGSNGDDDDVEYEDERSFASVSSLNTNLSERMQDLDLNNE
ncbi:expressed unknown protein [Seminavis robusta]|uniref:Uncharacterized protein n=1 Tax=Seminavis robusta TaxID=568900 RepID=A0A9N8HHE8_9STRA|nr:expressed unknown protein [Seminavis robusta]|eukprot:Sro533_g161650.1 n/a (532) ;mRNA; f:31955-33550